MHLVERIENYVKSTIFVKLSEFAILTEENLNITHSDNDTIIIDLYFPVENNDKIDITLVHRLIEELKNSFSNVKIDFNYLVGLRNKQLEIPKYLIEIYFSKEDQSYVANVPDIEGCTSYGATREEALKRCEKKLGNIIHQLHDSGESFPPTRSRRDPLEPFQLVK
ncbi:MAG: type II toxin-antitoxin system HicB family antitoxin [Candidatus Kariarchaeaceae archaeon]|jgi:predicted RNase H-like HicB family nuclease